MGLEKTLAEHVDGMVAVFREVRRVLRKDGTLWLNYGDSYAANVNGRAAADIVNDDRTFRDKPFSTIGPISNSRSSTLQGGKDINDRQMRVSNVAGSFGTLKPKDLCGVPWRIAFALQADGWWLRSDIIWSKPNPMPESVTDRPTKAHEYLFLLAKNERYFYDAEAIREPQTEGTFARFGNDGVRTGSGNKTTDSPNGFIRDKLAYANAILPNGRNRRTVWEIPTAPFSEAHFATFPPALIEPCIKAGCPQYTCGRCGIGLDSRYEKARSGTNGKTVQNMQVVRKQSLSGSPESGSQLLQQGLRFKVDGKEQTEHQRIHDNVEGISDAFSSRSSEHDGLWVCDGASASDGGSSRPAASQVGSGPPQGRQQTEQYTEQLGSSHQDIARQIAKTPNRKHSLPALQPEDIDFAVCPSCGAALHEVGIKPGLILDCFGGAGTTGLVADRLGRNAILIELNPQYAEMAEKRIKGDCPMFANIEPTEALIG